MPVLGKALGRPRGALNQVSYTFAFFAFGLPRVLPHVHANRIEGPDGLCATSQTGTGPSFFLELFMGG